MQGGNATSIDATVLKDALEKNNELSTATYLYTATGAIKDNNTFTLEALGISDAILPFTEATYVYQFNGTIKAGYDLSQINIQSTDENEVKITLPSAQVISHETDGVESIHEQLNILNPLHSGEETAWVEEQKEEMEQRAIGLGLLTEAQTNAKISLQDLFAPLLPKDCTITFEFLGE